MNMEDMLKKPRQLTLDDKLFLNKFKVDNNKPHLKFKDIEICRKCKSKDCMFVCPVGNYQEGKNGEVMLSWEGCLECGSCRIACKYDAIDTDILGSHTDPVSSSRTIKVGIHDDKFTSPMAGIIGELLAYNRALTPMEIQNIYLATKWRYR